jgi:hypothetical protein
MKALKFSTNQALETAAYSAEKQAAQGNPQLGDHRQPAVLLAFSLPL